MFGRRRYHETQTLLGEVRQRLDATDDRISALNESVGALQAELECSAAMNTVLARLVDDDRLERRALVDAVLQLPFRSATPPPTGARESDAPESSALDRGEVVLDADLDLLSQAVFDRGTPVACRFGDQWIKGVEIADVLEDAVETTYRVRRRRDGYVIPAAFRACDLSAVLEGAEPEPSEVANGRHREVMTRRPVEDS